MTAKTKTALGTEITTNFPDNTTGLITPAILRTSTQDFVDSWQQAPAVNAQTVTSYTVSIDDYGKAVTFSNASPVAVALPQATGSFSVFNVTIKNVGAGLVTITPATSTIRIGTTAVASFSLGTGQSLQIVSDGTNYQGVVNTLAFPAPFDAAAYYGLQVNEGIEWDQVWESTAQTCAAGGGGTSFFTTDCNKLFLEGTYVLTAQRVTDAPPGFGFSNKLTVATAQASLGVADVIHRFQYIEGWRVARLALGTANMQTFCIGWWVKTSIAGQVVNMVLANGGAEDRNYITKWTIASANTWTWISAVIPPIATGVWLGTTSGSLVCLLTLGAGTNYFGTANQWNTVSLADATSDVTNFSATLNATFQDVGPFVYPGSILPDSSQTPNLVRSYSEQERLVRRYYQKSFLVGTVPAQNAGVNTGEFIFPALQAGATLQKSSMFMFPTRLRVTATPTIYNPSVANAQIRDKTAAADCSGTASATNNSDQSFFVAATGAAGTAIGNTLAFHWTIDARM